MNKAFWLTVVSLSVSVLLLWSSWFPTDDNKGPALGSEPALDIRPAETLSSSNVAANHLPELPSLSEIARRDLPSYCRDGVERKRNSSVRRFLTTAKIHRKYGLTNVLMLLSSMFAYAALDDRGIALPRKSPVNLEGELLDIGATERCLAMSNTLIEPRSVVDSLHLKQVSAWRLGLHLGDRKLAGSLVAENASALLGKLKMNMGLTKHIPIVSYGDFFLRFPFYALRPLDVCYYLRRFQFQSSIVLEAQRQIAMMNAKGVKRYLALHLRLEADALKLDKRLTKIHSEEVFRFMAESIFPLVTRRKIQGLYLCAGALDEAYIQAVIDGCGVPVFRRTKQKQDPSLANASVTTNHVDAAVDLLVAEEAAVAVSAERSTFFLAILSRRCPSPKETISLQRFENSTLYQWKQPQRSSLPASEDDLTSFKEEGVWGYDMMTLIPGHTMLSPLNHVGCSRPWQGHCFY